jgi:hypothetical protein
MIIFMDILGGGQGWELCSDALPSTTLAGGAVMALESKKVKVGGEEINTGGNASKEEAEEGVEDEVKTVINLVDSHSLQPQKIEKKMFTTLQNGYYKSLLGEITKRKKVILYGSESKAPPSTTAEQKEEEKKIEAAAIAKLKGPTKTEFESIQARFNSFKTNFPAIQKFVKDEIMANFDEYEFYTAAEPATLGSCMIVPARYVGEALAPTFYFYVDGLVGEKS